MATLMEITYNVFETIGFIPPRIEVMAHEAGNDHANRRTLRMQWVHDADSEGRRMIRIQWVRDSERRERDSSFKATRVDS